MFDSAILYSRVVLLILSDNTTTVCVSVNDNIANVSLISPIAAEVFQLRSVYGQLISLDPGFHNYSAVKSRMNT